MIRPIIRAGLAGLVLLRGGITAPKELRYQLDYWSSQILDFSAVGQPVQRTGFGYRTWFREGFADSLPQLRRFTIIVDSARLEQGSLIPLPVESLPGASWTGLLRPDGRLENWSAVTDRPGAGHLRTLLWHFHPRVPPDLQLGAEWTDTATHRFTEINGSVEFTFITRYRAEGVDTVEGCPAYRLTGSIDWVQNAELQFTRGTGTMNGSGRGGGVFHVAVEDLRYLDGQQTVVSELVLARPGVPAVPVHDSTFTRVVLSR
ncbi:MAG TPA: hypothetical protein VH879_05230 [Gemmatimonadales bacterium]|jgi:hypothetical protein